MKLNPKFPSTTVAGVYKVAVAQNYMMDAVRFDRQKFNWTLKEFDRYSSAFAFGLVENGYNTGDKILVWMDQTNSAEVLVSVMGAAKAGVQVVTHSEKDECDSLHQALKDSGARGLFFSPSTTTNEEGTTNRQTFLQKLMPELESLYPGDALNLKNYPMLKQIVQTDHSNLRGVIKFKDSLVYANPKLSLFQLPANEPTTPLFECYRGGKRVAEHSNGAINEKSQELWQNHFTQTAGDVPDGKLFNVEVSSGQTAKPIFVSMDLETPLGFSAFLANASNHRKVFIPSTFKMSKIIKSISRQESHDLVCDQEFFELQAPGPLAAEYKDLCASVNSVVVAGSSCKSSFFDAKATFIDPLTL